MNATERILFSKTKVRYEPELRKLKNPELKNIMLKQFSEELYSPWCFHVLLSMHTNSEYLDELSKRYRRETLGIDKNICLTVRKRYWPMIIQTMSKDEMILYMILGIMLSEK